MLGDVAELEMREKRQRIEIQRNMDFIKSCVI